MAGYEPLDAMVVIANLKNDAQLKAMFPDSKVLINVNIAPREIKSGYYIVFNMVGEDDTNSIGGFRVFAAPTFYIEAIGKEVGYDILRPIMERIEKIISDPNGAQLVGTSWVGKFIRQNVIARADNIDSVRWFYLGGTYDTVVFTV